MTAREDAILSLEMMADADSPFWRLCDMTDSWRAWSLATKAMWAVRRWTRWHDDAYLEAAALLRDGWEPGDPVRRL